MDIANAINIDDLARLARRRLPGVVFDYLDGGAEDEVTLRANREAFEGYRFRPRVLTGNAERDLSITLFGERLALPFMVGPTGLNGIHWVDADLALARAAAEAGTVFTLSTPANNSIEQIAKATRGPKWFQLYPWGDRNLSARLIARAREAGYKVLVVTVDSLVAGKRERDARNKFSHELRFTPAVMLDGLTHPRWLAGVWLRRGMPRFENIAEFAAPGANASALAQFTRSQRNAGLAWSDIAWIKQQWGGPMLVKGVLSIGDLQRAAGAGADGIVISNHGGRQLDGAVATIDVLPEIVAAAGKDMAVLIDGGFRRGSDVVKAFALGASGVLLGRATLYGVAAGGQPGAAKAIAILRDEVDRVLALLGCRSMKEVSMKHLSSQVINRN
ncbi:MAG: alpha-hydroxy acid oxidase [Pseudomonadota bacterium]